MERLLLKALPRADLGRRHARGLRKKGLFPAILYGHKLPNVPLSVEGRLIDRALSHGTRVVDLEIDGKLQPALIKDVQYDAMGTDVIHVDFARVSLDERVEVEVGIEFVGEAKGARSGGVVDLTRKHLRIECLATAIPEQIRHNISGLDIGGSVTVAQLVVPDNVKVLDDPDAVVVVVHPPRVEVTEEVELEAAAEEPEVIREKKREEGEPGEGEAGR